MVLYHIIVPCDLGEVRCGREVEYMHVVKDVVSVEPAKHEEPRVGQQRSVITSRRRHLTEGRAGLILQRHCRGNESTPHERGPRTREAEKRLTKVEEEQLRGVLRAVVPTRNEKVGSYLYRRVR